jgi:hypothetical protein
MPGYSKSRLNITGDKILQDTKNLVTLIEDGKPLRVSIALDGMVIEV